MEGGRRKARAAVNGGRRVGRAREEGGGDVQVNLIVDPHAFNFDPYHDDEDNIGESDNDDDSGMPGGFTPPKPRSKGRERHQRRRGIPARLAMEESWRLARGWAKKLAVVDVAGVVLWGGAFVFILLGKRCPSGSFSGWYGFFLLLSLFLSLVECMMLTDSLPLYGYRCNAYNVSSTAACFLCVAFGVSVFFDVKDLHTSKVSPHAMHSSTWSLFVERWTIYLQIIYPLVSLLYHSIQWALDPCLRHSARLFLQHWSQLAVGKPPGHMFNLSFCTHF